MGIGLKFATLEQGEFTFVFDEFEIKNNHITQIGKNPKAVPCLTGFFQVFSTRSEQGLNLNRFVIWTKERKSNFDLFVSKYQEGTPNLKALKNAFDLVEENEWFCVLPSWLSLDTNETFGIQEELYKRNTGKTLGRQKILSPVTSNYNLLRFAGNVDWKVGQKDRTKRVCRWCRNNGDVVTFKEKAHAISEALGNKNLIILDECDSCNHRFANTIERDIINYFGFPNAMWGVVGKKGKTKIKTPSVEIASTGDREIEIITNQEIFREGSIKPLRIECGKITGQNIYKSFCKYALSLVDDEVLKSFDWTIDWINGSNRVEKLPIVKFFGMLESFHEFPVLLLHVRKNEDDSLPKMFGIFYHTNTAHLFIVPKDKTELNKFVIKKNFDNFLQTLPYGCTNWRDMDFSSNVEQRLEIELGFQQRKREK